MQTTQDKPEVVTDADGVETEVVTDADRIETALVLVDKAVATWGVARNLLTASEAYNAMLDVRSALTRDNN